MIYERGVIDIKLRFKSRNKKEIGYVLYLSLPLIYTIE